MKFHLSTKLILGFLAVVAIMCGLAAFALSEMGGLNENSTYIGTKSVPSVVVIGNIQEDIYDYRQQQLQHVLSFEQTEKDRLEKSMQADGAKIQDHLKSYTELVSNADDQAFYEKVAAEWNRYVTQSSAFLDPSRIWNTPGASGVLNGDAKTTFEQLGSDTAAWGQLNIDLTNQQLESSNQEYALSQKWVIALLVLAALIAAGIGFFLARSISRAVRQMVAAAESIANRDLALLSQVSAALAEGDLTQSIIFQSQEIQYNSSDEIGELARAFNRMVHSLQATGSSFDQMIQRLRESVGQIAANAGELSTASEHLASAANQAGRATDQIASTIQQVARGSAQQTASVTGTANSVEQLTLAIAGVAKGAQEQSQSVTRASELTGQMSSAIQKMAGSVEKGAKGSEKAAAVAQAGAKTVSATIDGMQSIQAKVALSAEKVREMGKRSEQIGTIVETIEDIASQTNLLSLNAAIEAARAGEHGKGFAVVADEVRKLAERASTSTKEIGKLVKEIQHTVGDAVAAMDEGASEVQRGVGQANQAGQALAEITQTAQQVSQQVAEIAAAARQMGAMSNELVASTDEVSAVVEENTASSEQMNASSQEVGQAIENIASVSQQNSAAVEEVSASTEEMSSQVEEVNASARSLAEMAQALQAVVAKFKLASA
jgi:methyl-accepting chemotaxis protein